MSSKSTISDIINKSNTICDLKTNLRIKQKELNKIDNRALYYWIERQIAHIEILEMIG
jgi:hypothetical protein